MEDVKYIQDPEYDDKNLPFDKDRFRTVWKKLSIWILLLFVGAILISYLAVRYTKPLYESSSILKLNIKRDASFLGLSEYDEEQAYNSLSSEMELLKSNLFFNKILETIDLNVSIYTIGKILLDERYTNPPFRVTYEIWNEAIYNTPIKVEIISEQEFKMAYILGGQEHESTYTFDRKIQTDDFVCTLELTDFYDHGMQDKEFYLFIYNRNYLLDYISQNLTVEPLNLNANTIEISFKSYNRFKARDLVNAIDTIYLRYTREEKNKANLQKINFLERQLRATEQRLTDFETYFEDFIIDNKSVDLTQNLSETIDFLNALDSQRYNIQLRFSRLQELKNELVTGESVNLGLSDYRIFPEHVIAEIDQLNELVAERDSKLLSHNENTQVYKKWEREINGIHTRIREFLTEYEEELLRRLESIDRRREQLEVEFVGLPSKNTEYTKSQRRYTLYEEFYLSLMQKKAEFQLAMAGTVTDFKILSPANLPSDPLKPQKSMIYGIGLVGWIVVSLMLIGIGYLSFNKITGRPELERLTDIPVLGSIPFYYSEKLPVSKIVVNGASKTAVSEAFRSIRTNMKFVHPDTPGIITSISSTVSGEGKTFTGLNLSSVFALSGKRVLIMDMDLRKPKFQKVFSNISNDKGISTILIGNDRIEDCIISTPIENLDILPSGPVPPNPSELIMSDLADSMFSALRKKYDMIFMDTPPIGIVTDGVLIMQKADVKVFVMRAEYSKRQFVEHLENVNKMHQFNHLYIVLNGVKQSRDIHHGYGHGSGYYQETRRKWLKHF